MAQLFALQRLLEIADDQAVKAAASLGGLNRQLLQHEEKLRLLFSYREEYQGKLRRAAAGGLDGAGLRNYHVFLEHLEQAIVQQHAQVINARAVAACGHAEWQLKQRKSKAYATLSQRSTMSARRSEWSREQKLQDDFASRASRGKSRPHG